MTFWDLVADAWKGFIDYARTGSSHILNIIRAVIYALMIFKVWEMTTEQSVAALAVAESILQGISAKTTVAAAKVNDRVTEARSKGYAEGVRVTESGTGSGGLTPAA